MWSLVGGTFKWIAIGAAGAEGADWAADKYLDKSNPIRQGLDNTVGKANSAAIGGAESAAGSLLDLDKLKPLLIGLVGKLDSLFGGDHFLGKLVAGMLPDNMLNPEERSKLKGTTVNEEWNANSMQEFAKFSSWNNAKAVQDMAVIAKDQGFTGTTPLDVLKQAHWAASEPLSLKNSEQLHYLESLPQAKAAGGVDPFVKAQIAAGVAPNGNELAVILKREAETTASVPGVAPTSPSETKILPAEPQQATVAARSHMDLRSQLPTGVVNGQAVVSATPSRPAAPTHPPLRSRSDNLNATLMAPVSDPSPSNTAPASMPPHAPGQVVKSPPAAPMRILTPHFGH